MIALALAYTGLAVIAGATLAARRAPLLARSAVILCVPALAFAVWQAAQAPSGWPTTAAVPKNAEFLWGDVHEPSQIDHDPGWIALWLRPPGSDRPRAYRVPYTRQTHQLVAAAEQAVKQHGRVGVQRVQHGSRGTATGRYRFYMLPPPALPMK